MHAPGDDRFFFTELRGCTAELARIIDGDLERPVPDLPGMDVPAAGHPCWARSPVGGADRVYPGHYANPDA